jgi:hypothetical protein
MAHTAIRLGYISTSGGGGGGILEFANLAAFPAIGQSSLIYLALDTKKIYKWSSGAYLLISPSEVTSVNTEVGAVVLDKTDIGLGNVDNTSDINKPISSATQTALNAKQDSLGFTPENVTNKTTNTSLGTSDTLYPTQNAVKSYVDTQITNNATPDATTLVKGKVKLAGDLAGTADLPTVPGLAGKEPTITAGTTSQYYRGDKTFQTLDKSAVGLSNVDNTSDANKPISSATQTALNAKVDTVLVGAINGVASLDGTGRVPSTQLPSYVDDVLEFANLAAFPVTGETGKIYVALDTNLTYRWSGTAYVNIAPSLALGETSSTAYRGDRGKTAFDHSQIIAGNPHGTTKADVGLSNVDNTSDLNKPISTATQTALNAKENSITAGTTSQYWRGDKTFQTLDKTAVGLSNVDNTSDANKPISTATQTALNGKANTAHVHALSDLTQSSATSGQVPSWNGTNWVPVTPTPGITDHTLLTNIGTNTHANIDSHISASANVHGVGVGNSVVGTGTSQALTNKTIDADLNTVSNIENADIKAAAAIDRTKLASGTINHVIINNASGVMSSEAALAASRGGLGTSGAAFTGVVKAATGVFSASTIVDADVAAAAAIARTKIANGTANHVVINNASGTLSSEAALAASRGGLGTSGAAFTGVVKAAAGVFSAATVVNADVSATAAIDRTKLASGTANRIVINNGTGVMADAAAITASRTLVSDANGIPTASATTSAELGFVSGVTSAIQTQINGKANTAHVHALSDLTQSSATSGQIPSWNGTNWVPVTPSVGVTDHTLLTNIGTNTHAQIDTFMANTTNVYTESKEPTGFFSRTTSTLSFDNGTRNFSITPTGATFDVWVKGVRYTKTGAQTIQIPALSGNHFIYFDATGTLATTQVSSSDLFIDNALISIIYWNTDTNTRTYFAEERHGMQMDGATHSYLHTVFGAQFISGLALQGFTVNGNGSLDVHAQFTSDSGTIKDEDITINISAQTQIPVLYRQGLLWRKKTADAFPFIYSGTAGYTGAAGRIPYNEFTGGAWQLTQIANNAFVLVHLFATNDIENPVVAIQGIATYGNVSAARLAASSEITSLSGLPFAEFVALGSVVLESSNSYSNTPQAVVRSVNGGDYVDFRGTQLYTPAGEPTTHGLLSGLSSDDHLQYHTDARGDIRYYTKAEVDTIIAGITSPGDLDDTAFSFANNQSAAANVTGFAFANATVRSFKALISVSVDATTDLFEMFEIEGIQKGSEWDYSISSRGDVTGLSFSITNAGQIQYTSPSFAGFVSGTIKFRALTTAL